MQAYLLCLLAILGLKDVIVRVEISPSYCGFGKIACVGETFTNEYTIRVEDPATDFTTDFWLKKVLPHELCHIKWDRDHLNDFGLLPSPEQKLRHRRVERCSKDLIRKAKKAKIVR